MRRPLCDVRLGDRADAVDVAAVVEDGVLVGLDCTASGWPIALGAEESAEAMDLALERLERELEQAYRDMEDQ